MDEALKKRFGLRVQELRRQRGMTQEQLAEAIGKTSDTVSNIESGRLGTRLDTLFLLADAFKVEPPELLRLPAEGEEPPGREHQTAVAAILRRIEAQPIQKLLWLSAMIDLALMCPNDQPEDRP